MRTLVTALGVVAVIAAPACSKMLDVTNTNNPDIQTALSSPTVLASLIASIDQRTFNDLHNCTNCLSPSLLVMAFQWYSTNANFGTSEREGLPRTPISNARNNSTFSENYYDFSAMSRDARLAAELVYTLDTLLAHGGTLGNPQTTNTGLNTVSRSFAMFVNAYALGNLALMYDSAAIVTPRTLPASDGTPPLSGYADVMKASLAQFDSAIAVASSSQAVGGFPLPSTWVNGNALSQADYVRMLRSDKARFRAGVARTPAERAAVDWSSVIADATNGITSDLVIQLNTSAGWGMGLEASLELGMPMFYFGMADTSGAYSAWLSEPLDSRLPFVLQTGDQRWPWGTTDTIQSRHGQANWVYNAFPYIVSAASLTNGIGWGYSQYSFRRFGAIQVGSGSGPWIEIPKIEIDMLAAEGYIREGNYAAAATLIDNSRLRVQLPPLTGYVKDATTPVPGATYLPIYQISQDLVNPKKLDTVQTGWKLGTVVPGSKSCVPQVPASPSFTTTVCGNIMEAMKYEKRMETALTGYGSWFIDARGWGDLPVGTTLEWPVPYQELDARQEPLYSLASIGPFAALRGVYGF